MEKPGVLHLILGLPPLRSGGMTRVVSDLIALEADSGRFGRVLALYAAAPRLFCRAPRIRKAFDTPEGARVYALYNPLPVGLLDGLASPQAEAADQSAVADHVLAFARRHRPDVIHMHTFMGFGASTALALRRAGLSLVYTAHDYYPLCPRAHCMDADARPCPAGSNAACARCCAGAPGRLTRLLRDSRIAYPIRRSPRLKAFFKRLAPSAAAQKSAPDAAWDARRSALTGALDQMDRVHFSSPVTRARFERAGFDGPSHVFPLWHAGMEEISPPKPARTSNVPAFLYLGGPSPEKGGRLVADAFSRLRAQSHAFELLALGLPRESSAALGDSLTELGAYDTGELPSLLARCDVLLVPSLTDAYSLIADEGARAGLALVISRHAGYSAYVSPDSGIVFDPLDEGSLYEACRVLLEDRSSLARLCEAARRHAASPYNRAQYLSDVLALYGFSPEGY